MPRYDGLEINPCIPNDWNGVKIKRVFRGTTYNILINNPNKLSKGIKELVVDGKLIKGNKVPVFTDNKEHSVEATIG